jgi:hypothetical protein
MLTRMTEEDWATVLEVFRACRSRRGAKGRNDRIVLEAVHDFWVHNITWHHVASRGITWHHLASLGAPCRPRAGTGIPCGSAFGA